MKLNINDIDDSPRELTYREPTATLNADLVHGGVQDFEFQDEATVHLSYHRSGDDLVFTGEITGEVVGHCSCCLESYPFTLSSQLTLIMVPKEAASTEVDESDEDMNLSFYQGEEIDLSPLIREQLILALPTKPLCGDDCKGLCPQCGVNRNLQTCTCRDQGGDPRLAVLRNIKLSH